MPLARALEVYAGPVARAHLREQGLRPQDVRVVAGAAGGPKGLILLPLDAYIFGHWLPQGGHCVDLVGASIGAWRLAAACLSDPRAALDQLGHDYIHERYGSVQGRMPPAAEVTRLFRHTLGRHFSGRVDEILAHPRYRLTILTAAGQGLLRHPGRWPITPGFIAAVALNALDRRLLAHLLRRCGFHADVQPPRWMLENRPSPAGDWVRLAPDNFEAALLASCTIPFWLEPVIDIPGAPPGAHWDGGLTDYHVHLPYRQLASGFALIPHFQPRLIPGWLDKPLSHRHRATAALDRAIVLCPSPEWVQALPARKIPDRSDFKRHLHEPEQRESLWRQALNASHQLAQEWAELVAAGPIDARPLF